MFQEASVYIDDIRVLPTYTAEVKVLNPDGTEASEATFVLKDFAGNEMELLPELSGTTYTFKGLYGPVTVIATVGSKTYDPVTVSKKLTDITIEESYTITLTLQDQNGNLISGASVKARKGVAEIGVFTDNGDGTYTLSGVMGTVSIVAVKEGYTFTRKDNVTAASSTLTMVGEKDGEENPDPNEPGEPGGCACGTVGFGGGFGGLMMLGGLTVLLPFLRRKSRS